MRVRRREGREDHGNGRCVFREKYMRIPACRELRYHKKEDPEPACDRANFIPSGRMMFTRCGQTDDTGERSRKREGNDHIIEKCHACNEVAGMQD